MRVTKRNWTVSIIYFVIVVLTLLLRISFSLGLPNFIPFDSDYLFTLCVQIFIFGIVPFTMYILGQFSFSDGTLPPLKSLAWRFGFTKKVSGRNCLRTVAITFLMMFTATFISWMWQSVLSALGFVQVSLGTEYTDIGVLFLQLLMVGVLPAFFEEFTHRGLIFAGFRTNSPKDAWKIVLLSALFFSLMHQNIRQTGYTFYDGIIMGLLCYYTGSIYPSIFAHFINNAGAVLSEYSQQHGGFYLYIDRIYNWLMSSAIGFAVFMLCVVGALTLLVFLFYRMRKDFIKEQANLLVKRAVFDGTVTIENSGTLAEKFALENGFHGDIAKDNKLTAEINLAENNSEAAENNYEIVGNQSEADNSRSEGNSSQIELKQGKLYPISDISLPEDFTKNFALPQRNRKAVFVFVTLGIGVACAIFSFVWGMLR
ncbi:MAG TPA: type II CAAX endopeptidase family protein [Clostridia bacterium]|nr:type II CAAX endopeptidase family protein [Clostridia bacterium]